MTRYILSVALLLANLGSAPALNAHEDHGLARILAQPQSVSVTDQGLALTLALENQRANAVVLEAAYADLGDIMVAPLMLGPGQRVFHDLTIITPQIPGIFTLVLDFGGAGYGPVTVTPGLN